MNIKIIVADSGSRWLPGDITRIGNIKIKILQVNSEGVKNGIRTTYALVEPELNFLGDD